MYEIDVCPSYQKKYQEESVDNSENLRKLNVIPELVGVVIRQIPKDIKQLHTAKKESLICFNSNIFILL